MLRNARGRGRASGQSPLVIGRSCSDPRRQTGARRRTKSASQFCLAAPAVAAARRAPAHAFLGRGQPRATRERCASGK
eukprot:3812813-Alexandrium_andersonii.AAC.1